MIRTSVWFDTIIVILIDFEKCSGANLVRRHNFTATFYFWRMSVKLQSNSQIYNNKFKRFPQFSATKFSNLCQKCGLYCLTLLWRAFGIKYMFMVNIEYDLVQCISERKKKKSHISMLIIRKTGPKNCLPTLQFYRKTTKEA